MPTLRRLVLLLLGFCAVVVLCTGRVVPDAAKRGVGELLGGGSEAPAQAPPVPQQQPAVHQQKPDQHFEEQPLQQHPGEQHPPGEAEAAAKAEQAGLLGKVVAGDQHTTTTTTSAASSSTTNTATTHTTPKATHAAEPTSAPAPPPTQASSTSSSTPTPTLLGEQSKNRPGVDWHVAAIAAIVVTAIGVTIIAALFWDTWTRLASDVCCGRRRHAKKDVDGEQLVPDWTRGSWGYSLKGTIGGGFPVFNTPPIGHNLAGTGAGTTGGRAAFVAAEEVVGSPPLAAPPPRLPRMRSPAMPTRDWSYNPGVNAAGLGIGGAPGGLARNRSVANRTRSDSDGRALPNPHDENPFATPKQEDYTPLSKVSVEREKNNEAYGGVL